MGRRATQRAEAAQSLGRYREAIEFSRIALGEDPEDAKARYTLGRAQWHLDRLDDAESTARALLEHAPEDPRHHGLLGDILTVDRRDGLDAHMVFLAGKRLCLGGQFALVVDHAVCAECPKFWTHHIKP